jgi:uncharacterized protein YkwD
LFSNLGRRSIVGAIAVGAFAGALIYVVDRRLDQNFGKLEIGIAFKPPGADVSSPMLSTTTTEVSSVVTSIVVVTTTTTSTTTSIPVLPSNVDSTWRNEVMRLTNTERLKQGLEEFATCVNLHNAAQGHADAMFEQDFYDHDNPFTGDDPSSRGEEAGYGPYVGENIAMGQQSPREVVRAWMNSTGHRENILGSYDHIGIGIVRGGSGKYGPGEWFYWVQNFGSSGAC